MNYGNGMSFKKSSRTKQLIEYIDLCERTNRGATRQGFIFDKLGRVIDADTSRGYLASLFAAAQNAGIIVKERVGGTFIYKRGPNAEKFLNGGF